MKQSFKTAAPDRYELLKGFARQNRREMTVSETELWKALRQEFKGLKFRRQHPIGDYIADFVCLPLKLVIEVDGGYHSEPQQQQEDQWRTDYLHSQGYSVLRFDNEAVNTDVKGVIKRIKEELIKIEEYDE
ncbi:MAG: endonuclease domain-containing protein [Prevotella sp.]|nr:endonuclease domain-containing protein [Prevotella sp.]